MKSISYKNIRNYLVESNSNKIFSIKLNNEFIRAYKRGFKKGCRYIVVYVFKNNLSVNRLGITVGKKFGNSVQRNRMKRLIRENYRLFGESLLKGYDIVIAARPSVRTAASPNNRLKAEKVPGYEDVRSDMQKAFISLDILCCENKH